VGIGERTLRSWLRVSAEDRTTWEDGVLITMGAKADVQRLAARVEQALAECESRCAQALTDAVGVVGKSGVPEWRPGPEWLKHSPSTRERWHEFRQVEVIRTDPFPELEQARKMPLDELEPAYNALSLPPGD
jgi:hypothetical protein